MESINKVTLQGKVGSVNVRPVGNKTCVKFSLCTEYVYENGDYSPIIEIDWFTVSTFHPEATKLQKNDIVKVIGRLRMFNYVRADGTDVRGVEVVSDDINLIQRNN